MHFLEICVFLGWVLRILWSEVTNNYGVPEIRVFLGWMLVILWPKVSFCIQKHSNFMLWVSFLAGVINWNRCAEFCSLL